IASRTEERRAVSSAPRGTSNGTRASARVRLARTIRWATVASGTRNARAISGVVNPPSRRSVRATRASGERTGWQAVKMRLKRSSPTVSSIAASLSCTAITCSVSSSRPSSSCLRSSTVFRRSRSIARCFAVAVSQAPGLSGRPDTGQRSSAMTNASWASSSASPTSRTIRASPAMILADSILQTASMARWISEGVIETDGSDLPTRRKMPRGAAMPALRTLALPGARLHVDKPGRGLGDIGGKVRHLLHLTDFDHLGLRARASLRPFDRFLLRLHLDHPVAADHLFRLAERPVGYLGLSTGERDAGAHRGRVEAIEREQHAGLLQGLVVLHHGGHGFGVRHGPRLCDLVSLWDHEHHKSHCHTS